MPNVKLLTFTRPLTEFVKTGCFDSQGREIFPPSCIQTLESWQRWLYAQHNVDLPVLPPDTTLTERKRELAKGAMGFAKRKKFPKYDALFVDEAQDLLPEEIDLLRQWSPVLFFVGDDRQRIYESKNWFRVGKANPSRIERKISSFSLSGCSGNLRDGGQDSDPAGRKQLEVNLSLRWS